MERFDVDAQTLNDLQVFGKGKRDRSVFSTFNFTTTLGGLEKLRIIFENPLIDIELIAHRKQLIAFLQKEAIEMDFDKESIDFIEFFLNQRTEPKPFSKFRVVKDSVNNFTGLTQESYNKLRGIHGILDLIKVLHEFSQNLNDDGLPELLLNIKTAVLEIAEVPDIKSGLNTRPGILNISELAKCDFLIRKTLLKKIKALLELVYQLDAYLSVVKAANTHGLSYPVLNGDKKRMIKMQGVFHLFVDDAIANDVEFSLDQNVCFVTGVNMAGKSTFLKSIAVCVYLAHLGFPVPARYMEFSVFDGLITTINLSDNLNEGYSHFYNEVRRVKHVAEKISASKSMVVVFDELFRGTNVKDAYDASLSIIDAFSKIRDSFFVVSTHITEVAKELEQNANINFSFLETRMVDGRPVFSYQLKKGITDERMGMWIVENEGILEILKGKIESNVLK
ncbi:MutS-related protein [Pedobacter frigoris]|uniref:DNA mismatch repair proteins mutS family domain-containing protein n=1 Tax=Pedobacter frigoris TaxID=2571272 RepID=A0A4U1CQD8_9SPHI|nr:hypothetical protein [Pedobacter frigoris]TKC09100.1 hypothetical protein FA047_03120 [Pedobacter frigoris]